jgi:hypothetical protein
MQNSIMGAAIAAGDVSVSVDTTNLRVTVTVSHSQPTFFAKIFGRASATIGATAVAEASKTATGSGCVKPFFIPNTVLSAQAGFNNPCDACNSATGSGLLVQYDAASNGYKVTSWAQGLITAGTNEFVVKPGDPSNALRPGDFYEVNLNGANNYRTNISTCAIGTFCGSQLSVLTGNKIGPSDQGVKSLIGCPTPDTYVSIGKYMSGTTGLPIDNSKSLVVCPIWDICNTNAGAVTFCANGGKFPGGSTPSLYIVGFAIVFIEGLSPNGNTSNVGCNGNNVVARLIGLGACADSPGGVSNGTGLPATETGPLSIPVRLVRTQ